MKKNVDFCLNTIKTFWRTRCCSSLASDDLVCYHSPSSLINHILHVLQQRWWQWRGRMFYNTWRVHVLPLSNCRCIYIFFLFTTLAFFKNTVLLAIRKIPRDIIGFAIIPKNDLCMQQSLNLKKNIWKLVHRTSVCILNVLNRFIDL